MPSVVEISPVILEKKIFKFRQCNFAISGVAVYLNKYVQSCPIGSGKEDENVESLQTDGHTDEQTDGRQAIRKAHLSFHHI